jgi:hypothetical protein
MVRRAQTALLAAALLGLAGCGDKAVPERADAPASTTERAAPAPAPSTPTTPPSTPTPQPDPRDLLDLLVPEGVPTAPGGPADEADLAVVERWLTALTKGDIAAAADTFADGTLVQNLRPPMRLADRADRLAFNRQFPCGAEIVDASSVKGYLVVTYRLTDRVDSPCDGPGGRAAGTIKVEGGKMTEWYRLPDPAEQGEPAGPEV